MQVCRLKKHRLLYSLPVILFFYFLAVQYDTKTPRDIQTNIEIAPKLPKKYVEPFRVKYDFSLDRGNSMKLPLAIGYSDRVVLMETLRQICRFFGANDIEWMMSDGSILGSLRHWDIVPWDDDFDMIVNVKDQDKMIRLLNSKALEEEYGLGWFLHNQIDFTNPVIKLFGLNSTSIKENIYRRMNGSPEHKAYKWPFVDVFFYSENRTHLWYEILENRGENFIPLESVFPLQLRPMGSYWFPGARNPLGYLDDYYSGCIRDKCIGSSWNHRLECFQFSTTFNCSELMNDYFFVSRECDQTGCLEKLMRGNITHKEILFPYY